MPACLLRKTNRLAGTKMPAEEPVQQSSQTEQEISAIVEKARRRRQQQNERRRSGMGARPASISSLPADSTVPDTRFSRANDVGPQGLAALDEEGIEEVNRSRRKY